MVIKKAKIKKTTRKKKASDYTAKDIFVLRGLEPVRKRPGMYIGSTGPEGLHHLLIEVMGNAIDEALAGYCNEIVVSLLPGDRVQIEDNGRGIPVDTHPQTKKSALETVMTFLHAGAKFGGKVYASSGGLHGVGVSVVCGLSKHMRVEVCREGMLYFQEYGRGRATSKIKKLGKCKKRGTKVLFEPDPQIFKEIKWSSKKILNYLRQQAYLTKGVKITFLDQREKEPQSYTFYFEGGLTSYLKCLTKESNLRHQNISYGKGEKDDILVEVALVYTKDYESFEESFVNNIFTADGGTHVTGLRIAITRTLNEFAKKEGFIKENGDNLSGQDVREGLTVVLSVKVKDPQFEGQTKRKLGNPEVRQVVTEIASEKFLEFLERNPRDAKAILEGCFLAQKARSAAKNAREIILKKGASRTLVLPGKLADCVTKKPEESELFIVEGQSAGGSGKQGRDRRFQAILPLRGKILNVEKSSLDKILASKEIRSLIVALGAAIAEDFDINKIRYHYIILMADSDIDGAHIRTLLLTLFYRYFRPLIERGYLYIAQPPLYRIQAGRTVKYVFTEEEKDKIVKELQREKQKSLDIQRYKGLGEMNPEQLWETTMNPEKRVLLRVEIGDAKEADRVFDTLMGEEVLPRKKFIQIHAKKVKNLDI